MPSDGYSAPIEHGYSCDPLVDDQFLNILGERDKLLQEVKDLKSEVMSLKNEIVDIKGKFFSLDKLQSDDSAV